MKKTVSFLGTKVAVCPDRGEGTGPSVCCSIHIMLGTSNTCRSLKNTSWPNTRSRPLPPNTTRLHVPHTQPHTATHSHTAMHRVSRGQQGSSSHAWRTG